MVEAIRTIMMTKEGLRQVRRNQVGYQVHLMEQLDKQVALKKVSLTATRKEQSRKEAARPQVQVTQ
jgi:hypothetical protein